MCEGGCASRPILETAPSLGVVSEPINVFFLVREPDSVVLNADPGTLLELYVFEPHS